MDEQILYKDQTAGILIIETGRNFVSESYQTYSLQYIKPDMTTGSFSAYQYPGEETSGSIAVDLTPEQYFDMSGDWKMRAILTKPGGGNYRGKIEIKTIHE